MASARPQSFADLLRHYRLAAELTQGDLAERARLSVEAISALERGVNQRPRKLTIDQLAEALHLSTEERARFEASARRWGAGNLTPVSDPPVSPAAAAQPSEVLPPPLKPGVPLRQRLRQLSGIQVALLIGLAVVIAAGVPGGLSLVRPPGPTGPVPVRGGTWTDDLPQQVDSLLPNSGGVAVNGLVEQALYLPLFYGDAHGVIHPGAARELPTLKNGGINTDATIWTFHLRPGLVWSDGQPYDARDVDYSWRLWLEPDFKLGFASNPTGYEMIRSATVSPDHLSITFWLKQPYVPFLQNWVDGVQAPLPAHHFSAMTPSQVQNSPDNLNPTVTSGAFRMQESQPGNHFTLVRNPRYYLASKGLPYLDTLVFRIADSDATLKDAQAGSIPSAFFLDASTIEPYQRLSDYTITTPPTSAAFEALFFNFHNIVLATHPEVREAIARAIDRQALIRGPLQGFAVPLCTDHPSAMHPGYDPDAPCPIFGPDAANKVLDDAGWVRGPDGVRAREGQRLEFEYSAPLTYHQWRTDIGSILQKNLLDVGIQLDVQNYPFEQYLDLLAAGEASPPTGAVAGRYDIAEFAWRFSSYDPDDSALLPCDQSGPLEGNAGFYCNRALDALYQQELATPDPGARQNIFAQIHAIYLKDFPFIVLFSPLDISIVHKGTQNYAPSPISGDTINIWEWWCDQGKC